MVEARENASTRPESAQLARQVEVALPRELSRSENIELAREFALNAFVQHGMVVDLNIHEPVSERDGEVQPHAHMLLTMREVTSEGFGNKVREWNDRALVQEWREAWAESVNTALERAGVAERVDHRTLEAQGIDRVPEPKLGAAAQAMEQRGMVTERGERLREVQALNAERAREHVPAASSKPVEHGSVDHGHGPSHETGQEAGHDAGHSVPPAHDIGTEM
ncbi:MAG: MobA/MobL family protein [Deltaproteobacteria bacterium]|nr:MobA/MobL family protein [Deltaproteobacteria bacterium]